METLVEARDRILAAWQGGLVTDQEVDAWSEEVLMGLEGPGAPDWLLELAEKGPAAYRESSEFDWPEPLDFVTNFALRAAALDLTHPVYVREFAQWAADHCIGLALEVPEVRMSYELDLLVNAHECLDLAIAQVRRDLPAMLDSCRKVAGQALDFSV